MIRTGGQLENLSKDKLIEVLIRIKDIFRSSHRRCSVRGGVLRNFTKFTGKRMCQSPYFNKVASLRPWRRCFPVKFTKFYKKI